MKLVISEVDHTYPCDVRVGMHGGQAFMVPRLRTRTTSSHIPDDITRHLHVL